jgi:IMP dehydrogenase/GMP reductase
MTELFDFDDILIEPTIISTIRSRSEINTRTENGTLPLMTAPMDTVIDKENYHLFLENGIIPVLPRTKDSETNHLDSNYFLSYSMTDFLNLFLNSTPEQLKNNQTVHVLIDVANGHMEDLINMTISAKKKYGDKLKLMVGNVANPETFFEYWKAGADYVRIGIGNGNGCLTTVQTGVGYPMASLISECRKIKNNGTFGDVKIVADGGFKKYSDVIKALALGADYVMLGSILNKCLESSGETTRIFQDKEHYIIDQYSTQAKEMLDVGIPLYKIFRGMSTKEVQKSWGKEVLTTSEGIVKTQEVEYTIEGWVNNMESYLKSAMSYTGKKELHQFVGGVRYNHITMNSFRRFDK